MPRVEYASGWGYKWNCSVPSPSNRFCQPVPDSSHQEEKASLGVTGKPSAPSAFHWDWKGQCNGGLDEGLNFLGVWGSPKDSSAEGQCADSLHWGAACSLPYLVLATSWIWFRTGDLYLQCSSPGVYSDHLGTLARGLYPLQQLDGPFST